MHSIRSIRAGLAVAAFCFAGVLPGCGPGEVPEEESVERQAEMQAEVQARDAESNEPRRR